MDTKLLIGLAIALGLLLIAFTGPEIEKPKPETQGELIASSSFILELEGTPILTEEYTIFHHPEEGYTLISQGALHVGDEPIHLVQTTQYDEALRAVDYELIGESEAVRDRITATAETNGLALKVETGGAEHSITVPVVSDYAILDNNLIGQFAMLLLAVQADAIGGDFTAVVPQKLLSLPGQIAGPERIEFVSGRATHEADLYRVGLGDTTVDLIESEGRLVGLVNRAQGTVGYDAGRFPEGIEVLEEEDALPAGLREVEVSFESGGVTLAGTLALPEAEEPLPAVLFLHGSGPIDRDGNAPGLPMDAYRQLAYGLAEAGIASLRYDKRGAGESGGDSTTASMTDLVGDARAALRALRDRPEIDPSRVILVGHSEGAYLAPQIAAEDDALAGIALLAGAARPLDEITRWQVETALRMSGADDEQVEASLEQQDEYTAFVENSTGEWADYTVEDLQNELAWLTDAAASQLLGTQLGLTWLREHYLANTQAVLAQVSVPVFVLNGEKDLQVPSSEGEAIREILEGVGNEDVAVHELADLNHLLRYHSEAPNLLFRHIEEPVDARVIELLREWAVEHVGG